MTVAEGTLKLKKLLEDDSSPKKRKHKADVILLAVIRSNLIGGVGLARAFNKVKKHE